MSVVNSLVVIRDRDFNDLVEAKRLLENPSFAIKIANFVGKPIEITMDMVNSDIINRATRVAIEKSLNIAINSMEQDRKDEPSNLKHKLLATASGFVGGFFGMSALAIELPLSTTIMLRSIADIAKSQGHNLNQMDTKFACMEVFSLGSNRSSEDDASESSYYLARASLAYELRLALKAVEGMSQKAINEAIAKGQMPILIKLINTVASRFGITVSEKVVAEALPVIGAIGGGGLNYLFIEHFQQMATGHFIVKRLEKEYGFQAVEEAYRKIIV